MVADPEGVWEKYNQAYAEAAATGRTGNFAGDRINDSDLVRRMTQEELDNLTDPVEGAFYATFED
jgi:hypothetical protein